MEAQARQVSNIIIICAKKARKKECDKKIVGKEYMEDRVINECLKILTDDKIKYIANRVAEECNKNPDNISVREIKKAIKEVDTAIENLWKAIEQGQAVDMFTERLNQRQAEKSELESQLAVESVYPKRKFWLSLIMYVKCHLMISISDGQL